MAKAPNATASQLATLGAGEPSVDAELSQFGVMAAAAYPADDVMASQLQVRGSGKPTLAAEASELFIMVAAKGRVSDPRVRAWTFTLDGHDFYVLRLGNSETLLYDTHSEEWTTWGSGDGNLWRAYTGGNWLAGQPQAAFYGSSIIVGDDGNGSLYFLDPRSDYDDDAIEGADIPRSFERLILGQFTIDGGYGATPCFGLELFGSIGQGDDLTTVKLEISDDRGVTYVDAGTLTVPVGVGDFRLVWPSLGSMVAPGRLFRITDNGALRRVDALNLEVEDGGE